MDGLMHVHIRCEFLLSLLALFQQIVLIQIYIHHLIKSWQTCSHHGEYLCNRYDLGVHVGMMVCDPKKGADLLKFSPAAWPKCLRVEVHIGCASFNSGV